MIRHGARENLVVVGFYRVAASQQFPKSGNGDGDWGACPHWKWSHGAESVAFLGGGLLLAHVLGGVSEGGQALAEPCGFQVGFEE